MFVWKSTYETLKNDSDELKVRNRYLDNLCDSLIDQNKLLKNYCDSYITALNQSKDSKISEEDIKKMLHLCHPDKHGGKKIAHEITQKLLAMRSR